MGIDEQLERIRSGGPGSWSPASGWGRRRWRRSSGATTKRAVWRPPASGRTGHPAVRLGTALRLGESETRLGAALASIGRDDVVVATKAGRSLVTSPSGDSDAVFDFSRDATLRQLESSLERLGLDRIDIVHIHDPEDHLARGDRRHVHGARSTAHRRCRAGRLARHERRRDGALLPAQRRPRLRDGRRSPHAARPLGRRRRRRVPRRPGSPTSPPACSTAACSPIRNRVRGSTTRPHRTTYSSGRRRSRAICESHGVSLRTAALHHPLTVDGVTAVIVGMSSPTEVDDNIADLAVHHPTGALDRPRHAKASGVAAETSAHLIGHPLPVDPPAKTLECIINIRLQVLPRCEAGHRPSPIELLK